VSSKFKNSRSSSCSGSSYEGSSSSQGSTDKDETAEKELTYFSREVQTVKENPEEQELKYSQDYVDTLIENNAILKEIIAEKDEEIQALTQSKISQNRLSKVEIKALNPETEINQDNVEKEVQVCIEDEDNELSFKLTKSKDLVRRYQDFFEDLQSSYSLPENLISEIEKLQDEYADLFAGNHISSKEF
jgi:CHAT domain-containing protein